LVRIGPTAWPFTGFIHTDIHTDRQLDKYILDYNYAKSWIWKHLNRLRIKNFVCLSAGFYKNYN
jgi:hypothetical protein